MNLQKLFHAQLHKFTMLLIIFVMILQVNVKDFSYNQNQFVLKIALNFIKYKNRILIIQQFKYVFLANSKMKKVIAMNNVLQQ